MSEKKQQLLPKHRPTVTSHNRRNHVDQSSAAALKEVFFNVTGDERLQKHNVYSVNKVKCCSITAYSGCSITSFEAVIACIKWRIYGDISLLLISYSNLLLTNQTIFQNQVFKLATNKYSTIRPPAAFPSAIVDGGPSN